MSVIHLRLGHITVEAPSEQLKSDLRIFSRIDGIGEYQPLYTQVRGGVDAIQTLPGFAERIRMVMPDAKVIDERMKLPCPDIDAAVKDAGGWSDMVVRAVQSGGGVVGIPAAFGEARMVASILRAYGHDGLLLRMTPFSVVVTDTQESAKRLHAGLRDLLPDRTIDLQTKSNMVDPEDILVTTYDMLDESPFGDTGVLIATGIDRIVNYMTMVVAEKVSAFRKAARWGISATPIGGTSFVGLVHEGLFGPTVASLTHSEAASAGLCWPVTVCWLKAPPPKAPTGYCSPELLEALAMQKNDEFLNLVSGIIRSIPDEFGCTCLVEKLALAEGLSKLLPKVPVVSKTQKKREISRILGELAEGKARKAIVQTVKPENKCGVVINTYCGYEKDVVVPGRACAFNKAYIVDFRHDWDVNNGRPGFLNLRDKERACRYRELGFMQMLADKDNLPFTSADVDV